MIPTSFNFVVPDSGERSGIVKDAQWERTGRWTTDSPPDGEIPPPPNPFGWYRLPALGLVFMFDNGRGGLVVSAIQASYKKELWERRADGDLYFAADMSHNLIRSYETSLPDHDFDLYLRRGKHDPSNYFLTVESEWFGDVYTDNEEDAWIRVLAIAEQVREIGFSWGLSLPTEYESQDHLAYIVAQPSKWDLWPIGVTAFREYWDYRFRFNFLAQGFPDTGNMLPLYAGGLTAVSAMCSGAAGMLSLAAALAALLGVSSAASSGGRVPKPSQREDNIDQYGLLS